MNYLEYKLEKSKASKNLSYWILLLPIIWLCPPSYGQEMDKIVEGIKYFEQLNFENNEEDFRLKDALLHDIKCRMDYLYYSNLFILVDYDVDTWNKTRKLLQIQAYPLGIARINKELNDKFIDLYIAAVRRLIHEYRGDLNNLYTIKIFVGFREMLYPFLESEIIAAGGDPNKNVGDGYVE